MTDPIKDNDDSKKIKAAAVFVVLDAENNLMFQIRTDDPIPSELLENMQNKDWLSKNLENYKLNIVDAIAIELACFGQKIVTEEKQKNEEA